MATGVVSELQRMLSIIDRETEAIACVAHGTIYGAARHDFIHARLRCLDQVHNQMAGLVGEEAAIAVITKIYNEKVE